MGRAANIAKRAALRNSGYRVVRVEKAAQEQAKSLGAFHAHGRLWMTQAAYDVFKQQHAAQQRAERLAAGADLRCLDGDHDWRDWDCGCMFGCGTCWATQQCARPHCGVLI